jgi:hypothetical protein
MESLEERDKNKKFDQKKNYIINLENNKKISCPPPIKRQLAFQKHILDIKTMNSVVQFLQK